MGEGGRTARDGCRKSKVAHGEVSEEEEGHEAVKTVLLQATPSASGRGHLTGLKPKSSADFVLSPSEDRSWYSSVPMYTCQLKRFPGRVIFLIQLTGNHSAFRLA